MERFVSCGVTPTRGKDGPPLELTDTQKRAIGFMAEKSCGVIKIPMGGGKTLAALCHLARQTRPSKDDWRPAIVVAPSQPVRDVWYSEISRCTTLASVSLMVCESKDQPKKREDLIGKRIVLVSYSQLLIMFKAAYELREDAVSYYDAAGRCRTKKGWIRREICESNILFRARYSTLILDECHTVRNGDSCTTAACAALSRRCSKRFGLTGTPVVNSPADLAGQMLALWAPDDRLRTPAFFGEKGNVSREARKIMMDSYLFSVDGSLLGFEMPPLDLRVRAVPHDLTGDALNKYNDQLTTAQNISLTMQMNGFSRELNARFRQAMFDCWRIGALGRAYVCFPGGSEALKSASASEVPLNPKIKAALEEAKALLPGEKIVFVADEVAPLALLRSALEAEGKRSAFFHGGVPPKKRSKILDTFLSAGPEAVDVLLLSSPSGGEGLNLVFPRLNRVVFLTVWWAPARMQQAYARVWRRGTVGTVRVTVIVAKGTLEEGILQGHVDKKKTADVLCEVGENKSEEVSWQARGRIARSVRRLTENAGSEADRVFPRRRLVPDDHPLDEWVREMAEFAPQDAKPVARRPERATPPTSKKIESRASWVRTLLATKARFKKKYTTRS